MKNKHIFVYVWLNDSLVVALVGVLVGVVVD